MFFAFHDGQTPAAASEYSWCSPPNTDLTCTIVPAGNRCRNSDFGNTDVIAGGLGIVVRKYSRRANGIVRPAPEMGKRLGKKAKKNRLSAVFFTLCNGCRYIK